MKDKVKDASKKNLVEACQLQVREAINTILAREGKLSQSTKNYIEVLEANIKRMPYVLGYLEWPDDKKKKKD